MARPEPRREGLTGRIVEMRDAMTVIHEARERARERSEAYRERRRHGRVSVPIEVEPRQLAALEG